MLEQELEKGLPPAAARLLNAIIAELDGCDWCDVVDRGGGSRVQRLPTALRCDAFAAWGSRTRGGRLFASRNLDWQKNTGIGRYKLVTVFEVTGGAGDGRHPHSVVADGARKYATFGFATGFGALAGMAAGGLTVSEMNLDNSHTTFDGPPFPLRLRMVLERASSLAEARTLWQATNNTDSMNFLIASSRERAAVAIEAIGGRFASDAPHPAFSAFFTANSSVEAEATCRVATDHAAATSAGPRGGTCGSGFPREPVMHGGVKAIGSPLSEAVWRTNHALHPTVMRTQEPLFNDTTFRYQLLHQLLAASGGASATSPAMDDPQAVGVAATLGIKGPDFLSCDASQFPHGSNIMSVVYAPTDAHEHDRGGPRAWVAWEDATTTGGRWRPAACSTYVRIDFSRFAWA